MYTCCTVHSQHAYFTQRVILQLIMYVHSDSWWKLVCQNDIVNMSTWTNSDSTDGYNSKSKTGLKTCWQEQHKTRLLQRNTTSDRVPGR